MDKIVKNMDNLIIIISRLAKWVEYNELPLIPYVGTAPGSFNNPPAPHLELVFVVRGEVPDLRVGDQVAPLAQHSLSAHSVHFGNYSGIPRQTRVWCMFFDLSQAEEFDDLNDRPLFCRGPVAHPQRVQQAFERVGVCCRMAGAAHPDYLEGVSAFDPNPDVRYSARLHLKAAILELLAVLLEEVRDSGLGTQAAMPDPVRRAMEFIAQRYDEPELRLGDIARAVSVSAVHLGRLFRRHVGAPPMAYLRRMRIEQSRYFLEHTQLRINEVAATVGFADPLHFSRLFRRQVGSSPRAYRRARSA